MPLRYGEAELLYTKALQLSKKVLGKEHPNTIISMNNLAMLYNAQGRYGAMSFNLNFFRIILLKS